MECFIGMEEMDENIEKPIEQNFYSASFKRQLMELSTNTESINHM